MAIFITPLEKNSNIVIIAVANLKLWYIAKSTRILADQSD